MSRVLITGINYTVDMRTVFQKIVVIFGVLFYQVFLLVSGFHGDVSNFYDKLSNVLFVS